MSGIITLIGSIVSGAALACAWLLTMLLPRRPISRLPRRAIVGLLVALSAYYLWLVISDILGPIHRADALQSFDTLLLALFMIAIVAPRVWEARRRH
jgi:H+/Cl- antiporter ClcA